MNIRELEDLRTKEELINYFKAMGQNITEEEIENLKKNCEQAEKTNSALTLQQLDGVAGGVLLEERVFSWFREKKGKFYSDSTKKDSFFNVIHRIVLHAVSKEASTEQGHEIVLHAVTGDKKPKEVPTEQGSEQPESSGNNATAISTNTTADTDQKSHESQMEQKHFTFYEHSFLGFGFGKEVTIEDKYVSALFTSTKKVDPSVPESGIHHVVDMQNSDVKGLVHTYADNKIAKYETIIEQAKQNRFGTYTDHLIKQYLQKIEHLNAMKDGKVPITRAELNHMFNKIYHKEGLAESLIHITAKDLLSCNSKLAHRVDLNKVEVQQINGQNLFHFQIKGDGTHGAEERLHSLNDGEDCKCILSTVDGQVHVIEPEAKSLIGNIMADPNVLVNSAINFGGAEFTKVADDAFSYINEDNDTTVTNSEGDCLFIIRDGKADYVTKEGAKFIVEKLDKTKVGETKEIAGATFKKEAKDMFSFVNSSEQMVLMNSEGKKWFNPSYTENFDDECLFDIDKDEVTKIRNSKGKLLFKAIERKVICISNCGKEFILNQLKGKEKIIIAGVTFTKLAGDAFSYINEDNDTTVTNSETNSEGDYLFKIRDGKADYVTKEGAEFIVKRLKETKVGKIKEIAGAKFKKLAEDVFSFVNSSKQRVLMNLEGNKIVFYVEPGSELVRFNLRDTNSIEPILNLLKEIRSGKTKKIEGIEFKKLGDNAFVCKAKDSNLVVCQNDEAPVYERVTIFDEVYKVYYNKGLFTTRGTCKINSSKREKVIVVRDSKGKEVFKIHEEKVLLDNYSYGKNEFAKFMVEQLKDKARGEKLIIAGAKFTKLGDYAFTYKNASNRAVVVSSVNNTFDNYYFNAEIVKVYYKEGLFTTRETRNINPLKKEEVTVVRDSKGKEIFTISEKDCVESISKEGAEFIADQLKEIEPGKSKKIADVEFTKWADDVFSYVDEEKHIVVMNSKNEVLAYFNEYGKVCDLDIDWVNGKLSNPYIITNEERDMLNKILRGLFKPIITDEGITLLQALNTVPKNELKFKLVEIAQEIGSVYSDLHNVYIDDDGIFCANGLKFKKAELRTLGDGHRCLHFSEEIIEASEQLSDKVNYEELRSKLTEVEEAIEEKRKAIQELLSLNAKMNELAQAATYEEENEIFEKIIASIIDIDPELAAQIIEKINERNELVEQRREENRNIFSRMSKICENREGMFPYLATKEDIETFNGATKKLMDQKHAELKEIHKKDNNQIEELYKEIKEKINAVFAPKKEESIKLEEELDALKAERYELINQLEQQYEITEPGELDIAMY